MKADKQTQMDFEHLYHKNQLMRRLRTEFEIPEVIAHCEKKGIPEKFGINLLMQMVLHKRASLTTLVGVLHKNFFGENTYQQCADMLLKAAQADMVDYNPLAGVFIMKIDVSPDVYEELERYQYPLPVLIEPAMVKDNKHNGYHSFGVQSSIILRNNHHDDDVCLDHINRANLTKLTINTDTAHMIKNQWRDLDKRRDGESVSDYQARCKSFERYDRSSKDVIDALVTWGNEFFLTHRYDKRGRTYCQGYHVNYQGNAWNKAVVELAHKEVVQL